MRNFTQKFLFLFVMLCCSFAMSAQLVQDFSKNEGGWLPITTVANEASYTSPGNDVWKMANIKFNSSYLMIYKNGHVTLPILDYPVASITVKNSGGASRSTKVSLFADGELIEAKVMSTLNFEYVWTVASQKANVEYKFEIADANSQFVKIAIEKQTSTSDIAPSESHLSFTAPKNGEKKKTIEVKAFGLTEDIAVSVTGEGAEYFSSNVATLPQEGGNVEIAFQGNVAGLYDAVLNFKSGSNEASVTLKGKTFETEGTLENPFSISDVFELNNELEGEFYVAGIMSGTATTTSASNESGMLAAPTKYNLALTSIEEKVCLAVELPEGSLRNELNLVENSAHLGKKVTVRGSLVSYFGRPGVKGTNGYKIEDGSFVGLNEKIASTTKVSAHNGVLSVCVEEDTVVEIYNITGSCVMTVPAIAGESTAIHTLSAGSVYLVKAGKEIVKVIL